MRIVKISFFTLLLALPLLVSPVAFAKSESELDESFGKLSGYMSKIPQERGIDADKLSANKQEWFGELLAIVQMAASEKCDFEQLNSYLKALNSLLTGMEELGLNRSDQERLLGTINKFLSYVNGLNTEESVKKELHEKIQAFAESLFDLELQDQEDGANKLTSLFKAPTLDAFKKELGSKLIKTDKKVIDNRSKLYKERDELQAALNKASLVSKDVNELLERRLDLGLLVHEFTIPNKPRLRKVLEPLLVNSSVQALAKDQPLKEGLLGKVFTFLVCGRNLDMLGRTKEDEAFRVTQDLVDSAARQKLSTDDFVQRLDSMVVQGNSPDSSGNKVQDDSDVLTDVDEATEKLLEDLRQSLLLDEKKDAEAFIYAVFVLNQLTGEGLENLVKLLQDMDDPLRGIGVFAGKLNCETDEEAMPKFLNEIGFFLAHLKCTPSGTQQALERLEKVINSLDGPSDREKKELLKSFSKLSESAEKGWDLSLFDSSSSGCLSPETLKKIVYLTQFIRDIPSHPILTSLMSLRGSVSDPKKIDVVEIRNSLEAFSENLTLPDFNELSKGERARWMFRAAILALLGKVSFPKELGGYLPVGVPVQKGVPSSSSTPNSSKKTSQFKNRYVAIGVVGALGLASVFYMWNKKFPAKAKTLTERYAIWEHAAVVLTILTVALAGAFYYRDTKKKRLRKS